MRYNHMSSKTSNRTAWHVLGSKNIKELNTITQSFLYREEYKNKTDTDCCLLYKLHSMMVPFIQLEIRCILGEL